MLRPIAALCLSLGLLAGQAAQAQPTTLDCIANGAMMILAFTAQPAMIGGSADANMWQYSVYLRARTNMRNASVLLSLEPALAPRVRPTEIRAGVDMHFVLGNWPGPRRSDAELRRALRVSCTLI